MSISSASESDSDIEDIIFYVAAVEHIKQVKREHRLLCQTQQYTSSPSTVWYENCHSLCSIT